VRGRGGATCEQLAADAGAPEEVETAFHILEHSQATWTGVTKQAGQRRSKQCTGWGEPRAHAQTCARSAVNSAEPAETGIPRAAWPA